MNKGQPSGSFLQRHCSEKSHAKQSPFLFRFFLQVVDLRACNESIPITAVFWKIFLNFSEHPSINTIVRSHLPKNDHVAEKTN